MSTKAAKYLHKYVSKGGDSAMVNVSSDGTPVRRNEVKEFQDVRSIGSCEATWRLFEFEMSDR